MIKKNTLLWIALILSGCTTSNEYFDCPAKGGVGCRSVSEVNQLLNQQQIDSGEEKAHLNFAVQKDTSSSSNSNPQNKMRIWCAPYEDERGNSFGEVVIHTSTDLNNEMGRIAS